MSESPYPSDKQDKFMLRLPDGMRDRIKIEAERNNRSMNAEIISRLETTFDMDSYQPVRNVETTPTQEEFDRLVLELSRLVKERRKND